MAAIDTLREALGAYDLRIELSTALGVKTGAHPCAILYVKTGVSTRWTKVDLPLLLPPEGGTRADLLRQFADILDEEKINS